MRGNPMSPMRGPPGGAGVNNMMRMHPEGAMSPQIRQHMRRTQQSQLRPSPAQSLTRLPRQQQPVKGSPASQPRMNRPVPVCLATSTPKQTAQVTTKQPQGAKNVTPTRTMISPAQLKAKMTASQSKMAAGTTNTTNAVTASPARVSTGGPGLTGAAKILKRLSSDRSTGGPPAKLIKTTPPAVSRYVILVISMNSFILFKTE